MLVVEERDKKAGKAGRGRRTAAVQISVTSLSNPYRG